MFISLDQNDTENFSAPNWYAYSPVVRKIISSYENRRHCFFLSPEQLDQITTYCDLNDTDRSILRGSYGSRMQDYAALFGNSKCNLIVDSRLQAVQIDTGTQYTVRMPPIAFGLLDILDPMGLMAENLANDSEWYLFLLRSLQPSMNLGHLGCGLRPMHTGGGGMVGHLPSVARGQTRGLCILDRDTDGNWVPPGTHVSTMRRAAIRARAMAKGDAIYSSVCPFFGIVTTAFRSVANSIPPTIVDHHYREWDIKPDFIRNFKAVFPQFPALTSDEWVLWLGLSFEVTPTVASARAAFGGRVAPAVVDRLCQAIAAGHAPLIPKNATGQILGECERRADGWVAADRLVVAALAADEYRIALIESFSSVAHLGAAVTSTAI